MGEGVSEGGREVLEFCNMRGGREEAIKRQSRETEREVEC